MTRGTGAPRSDLELAAQRMQATLRRPWTRALGALEDCLEAEEDVRRLVAGVRVGGVPRLWVLTTSKVVVCTQGRILTSRRSMPLGLIDGVAVVNGRRRSQLHAEGAGLVEVLYHVEGADAEAFARDLQTLLAERSPERGPGAERHAGVRVP